MTQALAILKMLSALCHISGFHTILSLATQHHMLCDHVDISQAFVQGDLLPGDGHNGKVYISPPPGFTEDDGYVYLMKPNESKSAKDTLCR